jgi:hypothetical protein
MTDEELIIIARGQAEGFRQMDGCCPRLGELPRVRLLEAVVVYFESDEHDGSIEVFLERVSGKVVSATLIPHKPKTSP